MARNNWNQTFYASLDGVGAVVDYGNGTCTGLSEPDAARAVARASRLPGFWRLKECKA